MVGTPERIELDQPDGIALRRARVGDAEAIARAVRESLDHLAVFMAWANEESCDPEFQAKRLVGVEAMWDRGEEWQYMIVGAGDDHTMLGSVGVMTRMGPGTRELGYWVCAEREGRGYIRTACRALVDRLLEQPDVDRVHICCDPANVRSAAVAMALGFHDDGVVEDHPTCEGVTRVYTLTATR